VCTPIMHQSCSILSLVPCESLTEGFPALLNALGTICFYSLYSGDGDVCVCLAEGLWSFIFLRATILRLDTYIFSDRARELSCLVAATGVTLCWSIPLCPATMQVCLRFSFLDSEDWAMFSYS
jgi:hypothetical protein